MADESNIKEKEQEKPVSAEQTVAGQEEPKAEKTGKKSSIKRFLPWIIPGAVVLVFAGAGFGLGRLLAGSGVDKSSESGQQNPQQVGEVENPTAAGSADAQKIWYYDLEPVVANLDEPSATRYVRAVLTLEINPQMDEKKGKSFLDEKKPILTNWLAIYFASLSIEDIRGERNLKSIQSQILDVFNEKLFPNSKPQIKGVLFKEFAIQ
jgi:flagellar basal body-associated protein FliL